MVFESFVTKLVNNTLSKYVEHLDTSQLKLDLLAGNTVLENLEVKADAFQEMNLPMKVCEGHIGKLTLNFPFKQLFSQPVIIELENVYILAVPNLSTAFKYDEEKDRRYNQESKQKNLHKIEIAKLKRLADDHAKHDKNAHSHVESEAGNKGTSEIKDSFLEKFLAHVVKNVHVKIKNIHLRYEDRFSNAERPFTMGFTLDGLFMQTVDEAGCPVSPREESTTDFHKLLRLSSLAVYCTTGSKTKFYSEKSSAKCMKYLQDSIHGPERPYTDHEFVIHPISADCQLHFQMHPEGHNFKVPEVQILFDCPEVRLSLSRAQLQDFGAFVESIDRTFIQAKHLKYRPVVPLHGHAREWWQYPVGVVLEGIVRRRRRMWLWEHIKAHRDLCKKYSELWEKKKMGHRLSSEEKANLEDLENILDVLNITLCRQRAEAEARKAARHHAVNPPSRSKRLLGWLGLVSTPEQDIKDAVSLEEKVTRSLSKKERKELYKAIEYSDTSGVWRPSKKDTSENQSDVQITKEYVAITAQALLRRIVVDLYDNEMQYPHILEVNVNEIGVFFEMRKVDASMKVSAFVKSALVVGARRSSQYNPPQLLSSRISKESRLHWLDMTFETNPVDEPADYSLKVAVEPLQLIYDADSIDKVAQFFTPPKNLRLPGIKASLLAKLDDVKCEFSEKLRALARSHEYIDAQIEILPSHILLPERGLYRRGCRMLVVDVGSVKVRSNKTVNLPYEIRHKVPQMSRAELQGLAENVYDTYDVTLKHTQVLLIGPQEMAMSEDFWHFFVHTKMETTHHILTPCHAELFVKRCFLTKNENLPKLRIDGRVDQISVDIVMETLQSTMDLLIHLPLPKGLSVTRKLKDSRMVELDDEMREFREFTTSHILRCLRQLQAAEDTLDTSGSSDEEGENEKPLESGETADTFEDTEGPPELERFESAVSQLSSVGDIAVSLNSEGEEEYFEDAPESLQHGAGTANANVTPAQPRLEDAALFKQSVREKKNYTEVDASLVLNAVVVRLRGEGNEGATEFGSTLVEMNLTKLATAFVAKTFEERVEISLGGAEITTPPWIDPATGIARKLLQTTPLRSAFSLKPFLEVKLVMADRRAPNFTSEHHNVRNNLSVEMGSRLDVALHQESIVHILSVVECMLVCVEPREASAKNVVVAREDAAVDKEGDLLNEVDKLVKRKHWRTEQRQQGYFQNPVKGMPASRLTPPMDITQWSASATCTELTVTVSTDNASLTAASIHGVEAELTVDYHKVVVKAALHQLLVLDNLPNSTYIKVLCMNPTKEPPLLSANFIIFREKTCCAENLLDLAKVDMDLSVFLTEIHAVLCYKYISHLMVFGKKLSRSINGVVTQVKYISPSKFPPPQSLETAKEPQKKSKPPLWQIIHKHIRKPTKQRIRVRIQLEAPTVFVPKNSRSNEGLFLSLGQLSLTNSFQAAPQEESHAVLDNVELKWKYIHVVRASVAQPSHPHRLTKRHNLLSPLRLSARMQRKLALSQPEFSTHLPNLLLEGNISSVKAKITQGDYTELFLIVYENLAEEIVQEAEDLIVAPPKRRRASSTVRPQRVSLQCDVSEPVLKLVMESNATAAASTSAGEVTVISPKPEMEPKSPFHEKETSVLEEENRAISAEEEAQETTAPNHSILQLSFNMDVLSLQVFKGTETIKKASKVEKARRSLCVLQLLGLGAMGKLLANNDMDFYARVGVLVLHDTRSTNSAMLQWSPRITKVIDVLSVGGEAAADSNTLMSVLLEKDDSGVPKVLIEVGSLQVFVCLSFVLELAEYFVLNIPARPRPSDRRIESQWELEKKKQRYRSHLITDNFKDELSTDNVPKKRPQEVTMKAVLHPPTIMFIVDTPARDERIETVDALAMTMEAEAVYEVKETLPIWNAALKHLQIYTCQVPLVDLRPGSQQFFYHELKKKLILSPTTAYLFATRQHGTIELEEIQITISPYLLSPVVKILDALKASPLSQKKADEQPMAKQTPLPNDFWMEKEFCLVELPSLAAAIDLRNDISEGHLNQSREHDLPESSVAALAAFRRSPYTAVMRMRVIRVVIESQLQSGAFVPMVIIESSIHGNVLGVFSDPVFSFDLDLAISFYNGQVNAWEPLIETIPEQNERRWSLHAETYNVRTAPVDVYSVAEEATEEWKDFTLSPNLFHRRVSLQSQDILEVTASTNAIFELKHLAETFVAAFEESLAKEQEDAMSQTDNTFENSTSFLITNETGVAMWIKLSDDLEPPTATSDVIYSDNAGSFILDHGKSVLVWESGYFPRYQPTTNLKLLHEQLNVERMEQPGMATLTFSLIDGTKKPPHHVLRLQHFNRRCFPVTEALIRTSVNSSVPSTTSPRFPAFVVVDMNSQLGQRTVNFRSSVQIRNSTNIPLELYYPIPSSKPDQPIDMAPVLRLPPHGKDVSMPLQLVATPELQGIAFLQDVDQRWGISGKALSWSVEAPDKQIVVCPSAEESEDLLMYFLVTKECQSALEYPTHGKENAAIFVLNIRAPICFHNHLPLTIFLTSKENNVQEILPGHCLAMHDIYKDQSVFRIGFEYMDTLWESEWRVNVGSKPMEHAVFKPCSFSPAMEELCLEMRFDVKGGQENYTLVAPYWIINNTGLSLEFKSSKRQQFKIPANFTGPYMFAFKSRSYAKCQRQQARKRGTVTEVAGSQSVERRRRYTEGQLEEYEASRVADFHRVPRRMSLLTRLRRASLSKSLRNGISEENISQSSSFSTSESSVSDLDTILPSSHISLNEVLQTPKRKRRSTLTRLRHKLRPRHKKSSGSLFMKVEESQWSRKKLPLRAPGSSGRFICARKHGRPYEFHLNIESSSSGLTNLVRIESFYVLLNNTPLELQFTEVNGQENVSRELVLVPPRVPSNQFVLEERTQWLDVAPQSVVPFWPRVQTSNLCLQCRVNSKMVWDAADASQPSSTSLPETRILADDVAGTITPLFQIDRSHSVFLKLPPMFGGVFVDVQSTDEVTVVSVSPYQEGMVLAKLVNCLRDTSIVYKQKDVPLSKELSPGHSVFYVWDEPRKERLLQWRLKGHPNNIWSNDLVKDGLGEVRTSDAVVYWVSFVHELQRVFLITEDFKMAEFVSAHEDLEPVNLELQLSLAGVGISLVDSSSAREILYLCIADSGPIWSVLENGRRTVLDVSRTRDMEWAYHLFQEDLENVPTLGSDVPFVRQVLMGEEEFSCNIAVDFQNFKVMAPFQMDIARFYEPGISLNFILTDSLKKVYFKLFYLQIDNQLCDAVFPVVFAPVPPPKSVEYTDPRPLLEVSLVVANTKVANVFRFKHTQALIHELRVQADYGLVSVLLRMFKPLTKPDGIAEEIAFEKDLHLSQRRLGDSSIIKAAMNSGSRSLFDYLHISTIRIHMSFSLTGAPKGRTATNEVLQVLMRSLGVVVADMQDVVFKLACYEKHNALMSISQFQSKVARHYISQAVKQFYVVVFGLDTFGNPVTVIRGIAKGAGDLVREPAKGITTQGGTKGFMRGLKVGGKSLAGHTVGGVSGGVSRVTGIIGKGLAALTLDERYQRARRERLGHLPNTMRGHLAVGGRGLALGIVEGVTGVVKQPQKGAKTGGSKGVLTGIGKGLLSLVTRPLSGLVDMANLSLEGVRHKTEPGIHNAVAHRVRPPRYISPSERVVRSYNLALATGYFLFQLLDSGKYISTDEYRWHMPTVDPKEVLLLTDIRLVLAEYSQLLEAWSTSWSVRLAEVTETPVIINGGGVNVRCDNVEHNVLANDPLVAEIMVEKLTAQVHFRQPREQRSR